MWLNNLFLEFHLHISNFAISYILLPGVEFLWLLFGNDLKKITWASLTALALNFIFECGLTLLGVDADYGTGGTSASVLAPYLINKSGLKENTATKHADLCGWSFVKMRNQTQHVATKE